MDLKEWTINYVKNKDIWNKKLLKHTISGEVIEFKFKDKLHDYIVKEKLNSEILKTWLKSNSITIVCLCIDDNFDFLLKHWDSLKENSKLSLIFVNLVENNKWIINPHTHSLIADPDSFEIGLKSMFEQVK